MKKLPPSITYYASDLSMGDTSRENCQKFREWAKRELEREYPDYRVNVVSEARFEARTTDKDKAEEIQHFCARLWDRCTWDWVEA